MGIETGYELKGRRQDGLLRSLINKEFTRTTKVFPSELFYDEQTLFRSLRSVIHECLLNNT